LGTPQDVFFRRHALDGIQTGLVIPRKMRMRLHHARHQKATRTVNHGLSRRGHVSHAIASAIDTDNFIALDQYFADKRHVTTGIKHIHVGKQHLVHGLSFKHVVSENRGSRVHIHAVFQSVSSDHNGSTPHSVRVAFVWPWRELNQALPPNPRLQ
jgi:hypothetical protein